MKNSFFEFVLGTPNDFLLGLCRLNDLESDGYVYNALGFGVLFCSIWYITDIRKKI